jgi:hypothetical protein
MARGESEKIIFKDDIDREAWLERLGRCWGKQGWRVHEWVMMGKHFPILVETPESNLVADMKWFMGVFSQWWNIRRKPRGHVFQGLYKAVVLNGEGSGMYFRIVADYIHLNSVRSGRVGGNSGKKLGAWSWSSFGQYGGKRGFPWVETSRVLAAFELDGKGRGHRAYVRYLEERAKDQKGVLSDASLKELRRGWCLSDTTFQDRILDALSEVIEKARPKGSVAGSIARTHDEAEAERMVTAALSELGVRTSADDLKGWERLRKEKALVAYVARSSTGVSNEWVADRLGMGHPSNVSRTVRRVSESRVLLQKAKALTKLGVKRARES